MKKIIFIVGIVIAFIFSTGFTVEAERTSKDAYGNEFTSYKDEQGIEYWVYSDHAICYGASCTNYPDNPIGLALKSVVVPEEFKGVPVTSIGIPNRGEYDGAFAGCVNLKSIVIPSTVTEICAGAF